ncbi:ubiquitin carboxyl-terminal hydrolase 31 [Exaiptasia diaphana]|uniref:Ubiquitin carboxyl-terminal hydrolase n=1 Tax=Exaiptasia diaphana TaxID=2652724 RepID=A0A913XBE2_EXADI|nr:ubiquitin carboxyl-terminal hydrolase 31 [Exaiptasia diaphana]KXJ26614.1 Ubiquitin carboxyl-terminal hydrolase 31 [Exaiptasia diaphana]
MSFTARAASVGELNGGQGVDEISADLERSKSSRSLEKKKSFRFRSKHRDESKKLTRSSSMKSLSHLLQKLVVRVSSVQLANNGSSFSTISSSKDELSVVEGSSYKKRDENDNTSRKPPEVYSLTGLKNHGNTCFMNAIIQCLAHTDYLAEYFVLGNYMQDMMKVRKGQNKKFGTRGEVTEKLAILLQNLWSSQYNAQISSDFKAIVGQHGLQYRGYAQHDAQEFLLWLLDKVHEDLNRATKKKYKPNKDNIGRSDECIAQESLSNHMRCNDSIVLDLFQAQYRSSLACPKCNQQSTTFDPFLCLSLPIPQRDTRPVYVTVVFVGSSRAPLRIGISVPVYSKISTLRASVSEMTEIPVGNLVITELAANGFQRTFRDHQSMSIIHEGDNIYAFECPKQLYPDPDSVGDMPLITYNDSGEHNQDSLVILISNCLVKGKNIKRFGPPFIVHVLREVSFTQLQSILLKAMGRMLKDNVHEVAKQKKPLFKLRVVGGNADKCYLSPDVIDHPLYQETVDSAVRSIEDKKSPNHMKIVVEWDEDIKANYVKPDINGKPEEHSSVREMENQFQTADGVDLNDCFSLYTREEQLGEDDAWLCPKCKTRQQGTVKRLSLWSLPEVLVVHLKRFRQTPSGRTKLNTFVHFPIADLDMTPHLEPRQKQSSDSHSLPSLTSWRRNRRNSSSTEENSYDLYAVCNHMGTMSGGHYTAYCKNPTDSQWYLFDDTRVEKMPTEKVVSSSAYLLFYVRHSSCPSSASESSAASDHWTRKIPQICSDSLASSREELDDDKSPTSSNKLSSSVDALNAANKQDTQKSKENLVVSESCV